MSPWVKRVSLPSLLSCMSQILISGHGCILIHFSCIGANLGPLLSLTPQVDFLVKQWPKNNHFVFEGVFNVKFLHSLQSGSLLLCRDRKH